VLVDVDARHMMGPEVKGKDRCSDLQGLIDPMVERKRGEGMLRCGFIVYGLRHRCEFGERESDVRVL
jgi:hypothetical protein